MAASADDTMLVRSVSPAEEQPGEQPGEQAEERTEEQAEERTEEQAEEQTEEQSEEGSEGQSEEETEYNLQDVYVSEDNYDTAKSDPVEILIKPHAFNAEALRLPDPTLADKDLDLEEAYIRARTDSICAKMLAMMLRYGSTDDVRGYLHNYEHQEVVDVLQNAAVADEWPVIFYGVERNCTETLRLLLMYGSRGALNKVTSRTSKIPLIGYAVLAGKHAATNTIEVVKLLLAAGTDPCIIPRYLWIQYWMRPTTAPSTSSAKAEDDHHDRAGEPRPDIWCTEKLIRRELVEGLTLSQRYFLWKAHHQRSVFPRRRQADDLLNLANLRELPYWLVGQSLASRIVASNVFSHILHEDPTPLTMTFAGPSGHGKTELAEHMAKLLNLPFQIIDCAQVKEEWALLGSSNGYLACDTGSPFNNFLAQNSGQRSVVFLDEFDKCAPAVFPALLLPLGSGRHKDRRDNTAVNCSKTIFIMATNHGDDVIEAFYKKYLAGLKEKDRAHANIDMLNAQLNTSFIDKFTAPLTGRMRAIIPFLPFDFHEQQVIAHGFLMQLAAPLRRRISLDDRDLLAHTHLYLHHDEKICAHLARTSYSVKLGARIIEKAVVQQVRIPLDELWGEQDEEITDAMNKRALVRYVVLVAPCGGGEEKIAISEKGTTA